MEKMREILRNAIFNVMEKMYFLLPDESYTCTDEGDIKDTVYIGITGNPGYLLSFSAERKLLLSMTADFLGLDIEEINDETVRNCLHETANVIGGRVLLSFENDSNRNITLPCIKREDVFGDCTGHNHITVNMSFNGLAFNTKSETVELKN
jgi:hypothetical protein